MRFLPHFLFWLDDLHQNHLIETVIVYPCVLIVHGVDCCMFMFYLCKSYMTQAFFSYRGADPPNPT